MVSFLYKVVASERMFEPPTEEHENVRKTVLVKWFKRPLGGLNLILMGHLSNTEDLPEEEDLSEMLLEIGLLGFLVGLILQAVS